MEKKTGKTTVSEIVSSFGIPGTSAKSRGFTAGWNTSLKEKLKKTENMLRT